MRRRTTRSRRHCGSRWPAGRRPRAGRARLHGRPGLPAGRVLRPRLLRRRRARVRRAAAATCPGSRAEAASVFRETAHGLKVLYDDGHLLELAVFDAAELALARVNRYRVLLDRADVMTADGSRRAGHRERRGGRGGDGRGAAGAVAVACSSAWAGTCAVSASAVATSSHAQALRHLLVLLERHVPSERRGLLDDLDPHRRFEAVYPDLGRQVRVGAVARDATGRGAPAGPGRAGAPGASGPASVRRLRCGPVAAAPPALTRGADDLAVTGTGHR